MKTFFCILMMLFSVSAQANKTTSQQGEPSAFFQADLAIGDAKTLSWDLAINREFFTPGFTLGLRFNYLTPGNIENLPSEHYLVESRYYFDKANKGLYFFGGAGLGYISVPWSVKFRQDPNKVADHVNLAFLSTEYGIGYSFSSWYIPTVFELKSQSFNWSTYHENYMTLSVGITAF